MSLMPLTKQKTRTDCGFVLVNALVLVAALAGVATFLLMRAEGARARHMQTQTAAQITLYLEAFEALSLSVLDADSAAGAMDHLGEAWARADYDVPLDRGRVAGNIRDLQGLLNVNGLASPSNVLAQESFATLIQRLGLSPALGEAIVEFLSPDGPSDTSTYTRQTPAIRPVGGPVLFLDQLRDIPLLSARDFARLRPYLTALPGNPPLNVNTAPSLVLQSMIPNLTPVITDRLVQSRRIEPFVSVDDFIERMGSFGISSGLEEEDLERLSIGSIWFSADIQAHLEGHTRYRVTVFERRPLPQGVRVAYRLNSTP